MFGDALLLFGFLQLILEFREKVLHRFSEREPMNCNELLFTSSCVRALGTIHLIHLGYGCNSMMLYVVCHLYLYYVDMNCRIRSLYWKFSSLWQSRRLLHSSNERCL